jgi:hypothetical protein
VPPPHQRSSGDRRSCPDVGGDAERAGCVSASGPIVQTGGEDAPAVRSGDEPTELIAPAQALLSVPGVRLPFPRERGAHPASGNGKDGLALVVHNPLDSWSDVDKMCRGGGARLPRFTGGVQGRVLQV